MASDSLNRVSKFNRPDVLSAIISNFAVIIQIIAVGSIGLADALKTSSFFQYKDLVTIANFVILLLSFSFIGVYSFHKANKTFGLSNPQNEGVVNKIWEWIFGKKTSYSLDNLNDKKLLKFLYLLLIVSVILFFYLTYKAYPQDIDLNLWEGILQLLTYILTLTTSSILIYIWIKDIFDKSNLFTESNFIPNLRSTLIEYGHIKSPAIVIHQNIQLDNGNRLLSVTIERNEKYFIFSFDGNKIHAEISKEQFQNILNPQTQGSDRPQ